MKTISFHFISSSDRSQIEFSIENETQFDKPLSWENFLYFFFFFYKKRGSVNFCIVRINNVCNELFQFEKKKEVNWKYSNWKGNELSTILTWSYHEFTIQCKCGAAHYNLSFDSKLTNWIFFHEWQALRYYSSIALFVILSTVVPLMWSFCCCWFLSYHCFNFSQFFSSSSLQFDIQFNKFKFFWCCILSKFIWMR